MLRRMLYCVICAWAAGGAGQPSRLSGTLLLANFERLDVADFAKGAARLTVQGAESVPGRRGRGVRITPGGCVAVSSAGNIDARRGTVLFWFKPDWPGEGGPPKKSHALLSWGWDDGGHGYCVLSAGWWEPAGANRTYLVFENQLYCHVSDTVEYRRGEWMHVAFTWEFGEKVVAALYINGERIGITPRRAYAKIPVPSTPIYLGSDKGTPLAAGRSADGVFDSFQILDRVLTPQEVRELYRSEEPDWQIIEKRRNAWLYDVLRMPYTPRRASDGTVLESRALLDETTAWTTPEGARKVVDKLVRAGFNVFIPCVWHGRGARWPSQLTPMEPGVRKTHDQQGPQYDALANLVALCHARGIEVHPWFCVCYGDPRWKPLSAYIEPGTPKGACEAHNPAFRSFIVNLMLEVVRRYDVDGINLDYIRTKGVSTSRTAIAAYKKRFGRDLLEDLKTPVPDGEPNPHLVQFQNEAIAHIVRRTAEGVRKIRPDIVISIDGHPRLPSERPGLQGRDGFAWAQNGWIDVLYSMDYGRTIAWRKYDAIRKALKRPSALVVLCGNYEREPDGTVRPRDAQRVAALIAFCQRKYPGNGVALYWLGSLDEAQIRALRSGPFRERARPFWIRANSARPQGLHE